MDTEGIHRPTMKRKQESLSLKKKVDILKAVKAGEKNKTTIANDFGIAKSTLSSVIKHQDRIMFAYESGTINTHRKRLRVSSYPELDRALLKWYQTALATNKPISGIALQKKVNEFAHEIGLDDFKCSTGWLDRFKIRHGISFRKISVESLKTSLNVQLTEWFEKIIPELLIKFQPKDIFIVQEIDIFYDQATVIGQRKGSTMYNPGSMTCLVCANMNGSEKLPLFIVGNIDHLNEQVLNSLSLHYEYHENSTITILIFEQWLQKLDFKLKQENRHIVMLMKSSSTYASFQTLEAIYQIFIPPKPEYLPLNRGVLQKLKKYHTKQVYDRLVGCSDNNDSIQIDAMESIRMMHLAWQNIKASTIALSFQRAHFFTNMTKFEIDSNDEENSTSDITTNIMDIRISIPKTSDANKLIKKEFDYQSTQSTVDDFQMSIMGQKNISDQGFQVSPVTHIITHSSSSMCDGNSCINDEINQDMAKKDALLVNVETFWPNKGPQSEVFKTSSVTRTTTIARENEPITDTIEMFCETGSMSNDQIHMKMELKDVHEIKLERTWPSKKYVKEALQTIQNFLQGCHENERAMDSLKEIKNFVQDIFSTGRQTKITDFLKNK